MRRVCRTEASREQAECDEWTFCDMSAPLSTVVYFRAHCSFGKIEPSYLGRYYSFSWLFPGVVVSVCTTDMGNYTKVFGGLLHCDSSILR